ncbi:GumC family protein [Nitrospirota bacterium]
MEEREIHLRDYLRVLRKRRGILVAFFIITFSLTLMYTYSLTPEYRATTRLLIEKSEMYSITEIGFTPYDPDFYRTQYQLIRSNLVAQRVVERLSDNEVFLYHFTHQDRGLKSRMPRWLGGTKGKEQEKGSPEEWFDNVSNEISAHIVVLPVRDTRIVEVSYFSPNAELARLVAMNVANAYIEALLDLRMSASQHALEWMTRKVEEERSQIEKAEADLQAYTQKNNIITLEDRLAIVPQKLAELSTQLTRSETKRKELETLYKKIQSLLPSIERAESLPVISSDNTVSSLRDQILKGEQNISELSKKYGAKHPLLIEALEDLQILKQRKSKEIMRVVESIKNEYDLARSNERNLSRLLNETKNTALGINEKFIQYSVLKRNVETSRQLFDSLMKRIKEQSINEEVQTVNVMLLEKAKTPRSPVKPKKSLNILIGLFAGLFGGILLAFFAEYFDNTVKTPDETESKLGIPVLGMVSQLRMKKMDKGRRIETIVMDEPKSTFTENYKALRTAIMLSSSESPPKTLLVTSMGPEEGKTSTSINLALAIAQSDKKVLLIDGDLRRPRIHSVFKLNNKNGLSNYLAGTAGKIIKEGPLKNINIIPSGPIPPNPSELLGSARFVKLLDSLKTQYDVIICDSPPALSVTDSIVMSRALDGTVIVARSGKTTYEVVRKGLKQFNDVNATVLGVLINAIDVTKGGYYYYHSYQYYHYYRDDSEPKKGR